MVKYYQHTISWGQLCVLSIVHCWGIIVCKLVPPLSENRFFTISSSIKHINVPKQFLQPYYQGQIISSDYLWGTLCVFDAIPDEGHHLMQISLAYWKLIWSA